MKARQVLKDNPFEVQEQSLLGKQKDVLEDQTD